MEECESGRIGTLGKRVWGNAPWVRIPPPPPKVSCSNQIRTADPEWVTGQLGESPRADQSLGGVDLTFKFAMGGSASGCNRERDAKGNDCVDVRVDQCRIDLAGGGGLFEFTVSGVGMGIGDLALVWALLWLVWRVIAEARA